MRHLDIGFVVLCQILIRDISGNIEGLQMTVSGRINSNTDSNRIDETCGYITVEGEDLLVDEKNFDRQTHAHHNSVPVELNNHRQNHFQKLSLAFKVTYTIQ